VAILGDGVSARHAGAIIASIGLNTWLGNSIDDYEATAVKFASQLDTLVNLRRELPSLVASSVAGNSVLYTRAVEKAYQNMWRDYCASVAN